MHKCKTCKGYDTKLRFWGYNEGGVIDKGALMRDTARRAWKPQVQMEVTLKVMVMYCFGAMVMACLVAMVVMVLVV